MKNRLRISLYTLATASLITLGVLANTVNAATLSTVVSTGGGQVGCGTVTGTTSASSSCSGVPSSFPAQIDISGSAEAAFGSVGMRMDTLLTTQDGIPGDNIGGQINASASAGANFVDTLTITNGPVSGFLQFEFDLGNTTVFDVVPGNSAPPGLASAHTLLSLTVHHNHQGSPNPYRIFTSLTETTESGSLVFNLAYSGGQTGLSVRMVGIASCGGLVNRGNEHCIISVDFLATLLGAIVLDENMVEVPGATINSESGFDYQLDEVTIAIDIKPGSDPNCFNANGHGVIPVAILGSSTFDVTLVDLSTLSFGGLEVRVRGNKGPLCNFEDSDGDTILDLVCHFEDDSTNWAPGDGDATITGTLLDGITEFEGTDTICVVP